MAGLARGVAADNQPPAYRQDFQSTGPGSVPEELFILDGRFEVREEEGNRFLELPGAPLDTFGFLFGPAAKDNQVITARILGTSRGRRLPAFGIGSGGQGGYRLYASPAKKEIELLLGTAVVKTVPLDWKSGEWLWFKLQIRRVDAGRWRVEGKVWPASVAEPADWSVTDETGEEPLNGKASAWGMPFSGTPIRFDDLVATSVEASK